MNLLFALALMAPADDGPRLDALARDYWESRLLAHPEEATFLGDRRYDDRLPDISLRAIPRDRLDDGARITWGALDYEIQSGLGVLRDRVEAWIREAERNALEPAQSTTPTTRVRRRPASCGRRC